MLETRRAPVVAGLMLAIFMSAMEATAVSTAMPTVISDLGGIAHYAWVFTAYMLASTVVVPICGKLADLHGRKPTLLAGIALFLIGSMLSGQARTMGQLIAFRAVQGLGAGAVQPVALTIVGDLFELRERAKMQGLFGAVWGVSGLVGPLLGGVIVSTIGWRWIFYVNVPFGLASAALLALFHHERVARREHGLDVLGAGVLSLAVVALLLGAQGGRALVALPAGLVLLLAFVAVERRAKEPLLPMPLFRRRVIATASVAGALIGGAMTSMVTYVPLHVQGVLGGTPSLAGAAIAPMVIGWPIASALSGRIIPRVGFRPLVRVGFLVVLAATIWTALVMNGRATPETARLPAGLLGVGLGLANTPLLLAVQTSVEWRERGVATASTMFFRMIGATLAVGAMGGVLASSLRGNIEAIAWRHATA
jgi:EmrB/QacA subfamily drug resistance transporter